MIEVKKNKVGDILLYFLVISIFCFDGDAKLIYIEYITAALFVGYVLIQLLKNRFLKMYYFLSWLPFVLICFLSCLWSADYGLSIVRCNTLLLNYILFGLMWVYVCDFGSIDVLSKAIAIAGGIFAVYIVLAYGGITSFISIMNNSAVRIGDKVGHLSRIGQSLSLSCTVAFNLALLCREKRKRYYYLLLVVTEALVVLASQSRTGLAIIIVGSLISVIFQMKSKSSKRWIFAVISLIAIAFVISQFVDLAALLSRWKGISDILSGESGDISANTRMGMIQNGWKLFVEKPIAGWGINSTETVSEYQTYLHNNYIEVLATVGLIGFVSFYYVYIKNLAIIAKNRIKDWHTSLSIILIIVQALLMVSTVSYYVRYQYLIIVYFMAVAYRNRIRQ